MPSETLNIAARIKTLNAVVTKKADRQIVAKALRAAKGDMSAALVSLKGKLPAAALKKVTLAHSLAVWSDDQVSVASVGWGEARTPELTHPLRRRYGDPD